MPAGRPPILAAEKQLLRALRHLTGCRIEGIIDVLENLGYPRSLPKRAGVRQWARQKGRTSDALKDLAIANVRTLRLGVIPIRGEGGRCYEVALLWEPVTRVMLGQVKASFDSKLEKYLAHAWRKLPSPLTAKILQIVCCRSNRPEVRNFWYGSINEIFNEYLGKNLLKLINIEQNDDEYARIDLQEICDKFPGGADDFVRQMLRKYMMLGVNSHDHSDLEIRWTDKLSPLYRAMKLADRPDRQNVKMSLLTGFG